MPIDLKGYKVIYKDRVYKALMADVRMIGQQDGSFGVGEKMLVTIINEDNNIQILDDYVIEFKFIN